MTLFLLHLQNEGVSRHKTLLLIFQFLSPLQDKKRPVLQSKLVGVLEMALRNPIVFGMFEKQDPGSYMR